MAVLNITDLKFAYVDNPASAGNSWAPVSSAGKSPVASAVPVVIEVLSLSVNAGEIVSILGASGCGKSTFLDLVAGLLKPQSGSISFEHGSKKQNIGYIFQNDALLPWLSVKDNLLIVTEIDKSVKKEIARSRIEAFLKTFHLSAEILMQYPAQLSGGMRQRVSIIQSLMFDPQLLLLDEPFSALDFYTKLSLETEFFELIRQQNKAAILVTHDIEEAIAMSDRVLIMKKGGCIVGEFKIDLGANRRPETSRGSEKFSRIYKDIWSVLKATIEEAPGGL